MNLARKLILGLAGGIFLVHAAAATYDILRDNELFELDVVRDARVLGRALAYAAEHAWDTGGEVEVNALAEYTTGRKPHTVIRFVWPTQRSGPAAPVVRPERLKALAKGEVVSIIDDAPDDLVLTYVPLDLAGGVKGALEIVDPLRFEQSNMRHSLLTSLATVLTLVSLCGVLAWLLVARWVGNPIRLLVSQARGVGEGDLGQRVPVSNDELGLLAVEMNRMCERLQEASQRADAEAAARALAIEQLRHADRLSTIGTLASSVAHELGTPINVIEGHSRLIQERGVDPGVSAHLQVIEAQCSRMATIIRQLLQFARRNREVQQVCSVVPVIRDTIQMLTPLTRGANVRVEPFLGDDEVRANVGAKALQQVLLNLGINAIQAMPTGGSLRFTLDEPTVVSTGDEPFVRIAVSDSGTGVAPELTERIFEPFFTTKDDREGTGLGLSIVSEIVHEHGGRIELGSSGSEGTTFYVYLPKR